MPRIAMATSAVERIADSDDEASTTRVDDLIQRGRSQGHLSLAELRTAFDQAGLTPGRGTVHSARAERGRRAAGQRAGRRNRPRLGQQGPRGVPRAVRRAHGRRRGAPSRLLGGGARGWPGGRRRYRPGRRRCCEPRGGGGGAQRPPTSLPRLTWTTRRPPWATRSTPTSSPSGAPACSRPSRRWTWPSGSRPACSPSTSWTPRPAWTRPSGVIWSWWPRTGGAPRRTCSRRTCAWSCRWPRSTATVACPCSTWCRKETSA